MRGYTSSEGWRCSIHRGSEPLSSMRRTIAKRLSEAKACVCVYVVTACVLCVFCVVSVCACVCACVCCVCFVCVLLCAL